MTADAGGRSDPGKDARPLPSGIVPRLLLTWRAPVRVMRAQSGLSDGGLAVILLLAMGLFFIAQLPMHNRAALVDPSIPLDARVGGALIGLLGIAPIIAYAVAGLIALPLRKWLSGHASRVALFWALLAISPAVLLCGLADIWLADAPALLVMQVATSVIFLIFWGAGIRAGWRQPA